MIALFIDDKNNQKAYPIGQNMDLQDAYNATLNLHFKPHKILLTSHNTDTQMDDKNIHTDLIIPKKKIGKHTIGEIMEKHNITEEQLLPLLEEGMKHELEHTDDILIAMSIAQDHIYETLDYYSRLKQLNLAKGGMAEVMAAGGRVPRLPKQNKMFHLPVEMAVYVPSTSNVSEMVSQKEMDSRVDIVKRTLANMFGGYTSANYIGGYMASNGKLVNEKVVRVVSYATPESFKENKAKLMKQIAAWANEWGQEAIGYEYEGDLFYIDAKYEKGGIFPPDYSNLTLDDI
jgi:hypothetical protein